MSLDATQRERCLSPRTGCCKGAQHDSTFDALGASNQESAGDPSLGALRLTERQEPVMDWRANVVTVWYNTGSGGGGWSTPRTLE